MRLLLLLAVLSATAETLYAAGKLVADFKSKSGEHITVSQEMKEYGLDLIITKPGVGTGSKKETRRRVRNAFGVVLEKPSAIFVCWIANGHFFAESFQVFDLVTFESSILKLDSDLLRSDELQCLIEENERYFLVYDDFAGGKTTYLFNREGKAIRTIEGALKKDIEIDGKTYRFVEGQEFGGFAYPQKVYRPQAGRS
jgi:hypothetical protein